MRIKIIIFGALTLASIAQEQPALSEGKNSSSPVAEKPEGKGDTRQAQKDSWAAKEDVKWARWDIHYLEDVNIEPPSIISESDRTSHMASKKMWLPRIARATSLEMPEDLSVPSIAAFIAEARKRLGPEERPVDLSKGIGDPAVEAMLKNKDFEALTAFMGEAKDEDLVLKTIYSISDECSGYAGFMIPLLEKNNPEFVVGGSESFMGAILLKKALVSAIAKDLKMEEIENLTHSSVKTFIAETKDKLKTKGGSKPVKIPALDPQASQGGTSDSKNEATKPSIGENSNSVTIWALVALSLVALFGILWILFKKA